MAKRQRLTVTEVLDTVCSDDDEDLDDLDEPMMEGSDDEFSDLEMCDSDDDYMDPSDPPSLSKNNLSPQGYG